MKRWRRSFPSTCSLELALALDHLLSLHHVVVPVPPLPTENLLPPAGLVVQHNLPDHHKVNAACVVGHTHLVSGCLKISSIIRFQSLCASVYKL